MIISTPAITCEWSPDCFHFDCSSRHRSMTLKIRPVIRKRERRIYLSGQLRSEHIDQLNAEVERGGTGVTLDLEEVDLVDIAAVRFLNACELAGTSLLHCSPYIKEWMLQERERSREMGLLADEKQSVQKTLRVKRTEMKKGKQQ